MSEARVGGLTADIRGELPLAAGRFTLRLSASLGTAYYAADESSDGSKGAEFSRNGLLYPMRDFGLRLGGAVGLCAARGWVCVDAGLTGDVAVNPDILVVDGGELRHGFSPVGFDVTLSIDPLTAAR